MSQTNIRGGQIADSSSGVSLTVDVTGTLPVANGGTGAVSLTGLVKGTGTTAMVAATPGTDYVTPTGVETLTNKNLTSGTNTFPTFNQNTTGTAAGLSATLAVASGGTGATTAAGALTNLAIPADFVIVQSGATRATGSGDFTVGFYVGRAFTATKVVYQFETADASGSTTVELRRNGTQVTSSSVAVTAANQADGTGTDAARTVTISQSFAVGDRINLQITGIGTTPGKGLKAWIVGTWN